MILGFLRCLVLPHRPDRRRVKKIALEQYYGYCAFCGARIRRHRRDSWSRARTWPEGPLE